MRKRIQRARRRRNERRNMQRAALNAWRVAEATRAAQERKPARNAEHPPSGA